MTKEELIRRKKFCQSMIDKLTDAQIQLADGGVKSYMVGDRQLTRYNLKEIQDMIDAYEKKLDELEALAAGKSRRRAFAVVPVE